MSSKKVVIELKGNLVKFFSEELSDKIFTISCNAEFTVLDMLKLLKIPKERVALIRVNNLVSSLSSKPKEGDKVALYPFVCGG